MRIACTVTLPHLDSFYGGQPNAARIARPGGALHVDYTIPFRQCVVQYGLDFYVPLSLTHKKGLMLRVMHLLPDGTATMDSSFECVHATRR